MSQIKIWIAETHLIKIKYFQAAVNQDMFIMKIFVNWGTKVKVELRRLFDQIICDMLRCLAFPGIFIADQLRPLSYAIDLILNSEYFF